MQGMEIGRRRRKKQAKESQKFRIICNQCNKSFLVKKFQGSVVVVRARNHGRPFPGWAFGLC
jgi:hypothetical protein